MISSRADYDFVTFPGGVLVNGGIMPLRSGEALRALRLEDVGFLYEAMCERQTAMGESANHATLTKEIRAYNLSTVANGLTALAPRWMTDFEPAKKEVEGADGNTIAGIYGNKSTAPTATFAVGSPLVAADVKNLFDSVKSMRQFEAEGRPTMNVGSTAYTYSYGPDKRFDRQPNAPTYARLLIGYAANSFSCTAGTYDGTYYNDYASGGYEYYNRATSGTYKVDVAVGGEYLGEVSAIAIMRLRKTEKPYEGGEGETVTKYFSAKTNATCTDGVVAVQLSDLLTVADELTSGFERPGYETKAYNIFEWDVAMMDLLVLCKLGEHTKF